VIVGAAVTPAASAATTPTRTVFDAEGNLVETPLVPQAESPRLNEQRATAAFVSYPKVADWLDRYPTRGRVTEATFDEGARSWRVKVWWGDAGQIADGRVDDRSARVTEAWTGPQVAWKMARGYSGAFGGKEINRPLIWLMLCGAFLIGLADLRRPLSVRNLDLLALLSFSISLYYFNRGDIFTSVPLAYPPLVYVIARMAWIGARDRPPRGRSIWPVWVLIAATVFLAGFRIGLNIESSNVIDVGYSGVIGGHRLANGEIPYGHMPVQDDLRPCGPADAEGEIRDRIQTNGRCESSNDRGDTYGPVAYLAYVPGYLAMGWSGKWDDLPAAKFTALAFDVLCIVALGLIGRRFGGIRLGATLAFAWTANPFTQYVSNSNTNDAIMPALLLFGFLLLTTPFWRGWFGALAGWVKFAALIVAPLWATYPDVRRRVRDKLVFGIGFVAATVAAFAMLLLEPSALDAAKTFWDRTLGWQLGRESPFSIWDWDQYHARGIPDLSLPHQVVKGVVLVGALTVAVLPLRKTPLQLAALTAALIAAFQLVLTHWFYLYIPWFLPFVAIALFYRDRDDARPA
jgi:hypothetical protein